MRNEERISVIYKKLEKKYELGRRIKKPSSKSNLMRNGHVNSKRDDGIS